MIDSMGFLYFIWKWRSILNLMKLGNGEESPLSIATSSSFEWNASKSVYTQLGNSVILIFVSSSICLHLEFFDQSVAEERVPWFLHQSVHWEKLENFHLNFLKLIQKYSPAWRIYTKTFQKGMPWRRTQMDSMNGMCCLVSNAQSNSVILNVIIILSCSRFK